jgi:outer membrane protein OmpA-like peptidoglycan-associated protein
VSYTTNIAKWMGALAVCGLVPACSFEASVRAGGGAKSAPDGQSSGAPLSNAEPGPEPAAAPKANVKVNGAKLEVPGGVYFQRDSALFQPGAGSEATLMEMKAYLEQNARVTRLRIEGHTNNARGPEKSLQLSGERAQAVKQWLRENGIHEGRLLAVGFGDTQPVASNADAAGQAQNERIVFRIAELDGKPYLGPDPLAGGTEFP